MSVNYTSVIGEGVAEYDITYRSLIELGETNMNANVNEMKTINSAFDADEIKLSDLEALDLVLQKPEHREAFLQQIDSLVRDKEELLRLQDAYKELIKSTKEAFKFKTASFINTTVDSIVKDKLEDNIATAVAEADLLEIVKQHVDGVNE